MAVLIALRSSLSGANSATPAKSPDLVSRRYAIRRRRPPSRTVGSRPGRSPPRGRRWQPACRSRRARSTLGLALSRSINRFLPSWSCLGKFDLFDGLDAGGLECLAQGCDTIIDERVAGGIDEDDRASLGVELGVLGVAHRRGDELLGERCERRSGDHGQGRFGVGGRRRLGLARCTLGAGAVAVAGLASERAALSGCPLSRGLSIMTTGTPLARASRTASASLRSAGSAGSMTRARALRAAPQ